MLQAGFDEATYVQRIYKIPVGIWPKSKEEKKLGAMNLVNLLMGMGGSTPKSEEGRYPNTSQRGLCWHSTRECWENRRSLQKITLKSAKRSFEIRKSIRTLNCENFTTFDASANR